MVSDATIKVHHVTRVEGHGDIEAEIRAGRLDNVKFAVVEAPRYFEALLQGQSYQEVVHIAPRICGICSVSHKTAALKATEQAFSVEISEQTQLLRALAFMGEIISSHVLHVYFLALPDFLGAPSVLPLARTNRDVVLQGMRLKTLGYDICRVVVGRHTHPVGMRVGGFTFTHSPDGLIDLKGRIEHAFADVGEGINLYKTLNIPQFERETEYVSLKHPEHYALFDGDLYSSEGTTVPVAHYRDAIREYVVPHSTAKHAGWHGPAYMVGALARVNNNYAQLNPRAQQAAKDLDLNVPCHNPFMITEAQIVETVHCLEESISLIDTLVAKGLDPWSEEVSVRPAAGLGVGAVEAPRGVLFHEYGYDGDGLCTSANHVIPTAQNMANLEADMREYVPVVLHETEDTVRHHLEMLVRAYDPCISCSTHLVHLTMDE